MRRRDFLIVSGGLVIGVVGCAGDEPDRGDPGPGPDGGASPDAAPGAPDARSTADAEPGCDAGVAVVYDTYAQALYLDGSYGPLTGIIEADQIAAGQPVDFDFWHGHNGQQHRFTVNAGHFARLLRGERVYIETTEVESHSHMLFIDPTLPEYRVEGAEPVEVPLGC